MIPTKHQSQHKRWGAIPGSWSSELQRYIKDKDGHNTHIVQRVTGGKKVLWIHESKLTRGLVHIQLKWEAENNSQTPTSSYYSILLFTTSLIECLFDRVITQLSILNMIWHTGRRFPWWTRQHQHNVTVVLNWTLSFWTQWSFRASLCVIVKHYSPRQRVMFP